MIGDEKFYPSFTVNNAAKDEQRIFLSDEEKEKCFEYMQQDKAVETEPTVQDGEVSAESVEDTIAEIAESSEEVVAEKVVEEEVKEELTQNDSEVK